MLAQATTIQNAKELKDLALTAADLAKRQRLGEAAVQHARSYALPAEWQIGEFVPRQNQIGFLNCLDLGLHDAS